MCVKLLRNLFVVNLLRHMLLIDNELRDRFGCVASPFSRAKTGEWQVADATRKTRGGNVFSGLERAFSEVGIPN